MRKVIGLTPITIKTIIEILQINLVSDEPIDSFEFCDFKKLDSSLKTLFQRPSKPLFVEELIEKCSLLFFLLIENHVLPTNGNKRLATLALVSMLDINNYQLSCSDQELYILAVEVAQSKKKI